jgi:hypothetical protein
MREPLASPADSRRALLELIVTLLGPEALTREDRETAARLLFRFAFGRRDGG